MSEVTVKHLAGVIGVPVDRLLGQLEEAGLKVDGADATISEKDKLLLLSHLRKSHGKSDAADPVVAPKKVTLRRKTVSELKQRSGTVSGRAVRNTKTVSVEVRKRRTYVKRSEIQDSDDVVREAEQAKVALEEQVRARAEDEAQLKAKERQREEERARKEDAERRAREAEERRLLEEQKKESEEVERQALEEARREEESKRKLEEARKAEQARASKEAASRGPGKGTRGKAAGKGRGREELHVAAGKKGRRKKKGRGPVARPRGEGKHGFAMPTEPVVREVEIPDSITVGELAQRMSIKVNELVGVLFKMGAMVTSNQPLDQETAAIVVEELGHKAILAQPSDIESEVMESDALEGEPEPRAPVVTIMGHVDHGKTSLLDYIRRSRVADGEAGGITQHIGAYHVDTDKGSITFLDTPGHAAFTSMRARGAKVTDIVVLVVAADDGVKPQTIEAIQHARAAEVPLVVAVNKIDKPEADLDRVRQELVAQEVVPEDWGGDTQFINVSAKTGEGVGDLLDGLLLQAELLELKAVREGAARGTLVESSLEKGRGPVATVLVQQGTLKRGDVLVAGTEFGRIRAMFDEAGRALPEAGPSTPAVILGLSGAPSAGDDMRVLPDERRARELAEFRREKVRETRLASQQMVKLEDVFANIGTGEVHYLNLVLKGDVQGSVEALRESLSKLSTDEVKVRFVGSGVGGINESDVTLAAASNAVIIGFNVRADASARAIIDERGLDLHYYSVIYEVVDDVKKAMEGMLSPEIKEQIVGLAEVRDVFRSAKLGAIAGCMVLEGSVKRNNPIRVLRDHVVIYEGALESLRRYKDDVAEVKAGTECGIGVKNYNDVKPGDQIEVFERTEVARTL